MQEKKKQIIMLVDDNHTNLTMGKSILEKHYDVYTLPSAGKLFEFLKKVRPDLILLDIDMPEINGYMAIKLLKEEQMYSDIPVIFLTAKSSESDEYEGLTMGAIDYITKPFAPALLLKRIETHLTLQKQKAYLQNINNNLIKIVKEKTREVIGLHNAIIGNMANLVEFRDDCTGWHIKRTQKYLEKLTGQLFRDGVYSNELNEWDMNIVLLSSQLHDIGKVGISDVILKKPGRLTSEEFEIMKTHTQRGVDALLKMENFDTSSNFLEHAKSFSLTHHEKWDGTGYPIGLKGMDIPLEGRIMAVADVYDALTTVRSYKKAFSVEETTGIMLANSGKHFDPALINTFKKVQNEFANIAAECAER